MSDPILSLLTHEDPKQRKRGISAAAKKSDRRYLKHLSRMVREDDDPSVREMAKKAGTYIHKQTATTQKPEPQVNNKPIKQPQKSSPTEALTGLDLNSLGGVSSTSNQEEAETHYNEAFELHLKGDNARAVLELGTAFYLDSTYATNDTALAFAAELTGVPKERAAEVISNPDNWRKLADKYGGFKKKESRSETQSLLLWFAGALLIIVVVALLFLLLQSEAFGLVIQDSLGNLTGGTTATATPIPQ